MGPYLFVNTALVGFFAFAAVHYFWHWRASREGALLAFTIHCSLLTFFSIGLAALALAPSVDAAQTALDAITSLGLLWHATEASVLWLVTGLRARAFIGFVFAVLVPLSAINLWVLPLSGVVTAIQPIELPWGEVIMVPVRGPPQWWQISIFLLVASVEVVGFLGAARMWSRDRLGAALVIIGSAGMSANHVAAALIEYAQLGAAYVGALPQALFVAVIGMQLSRELARRGRELAASERRFRALAERMTVGEEALRQSEERYRLIVKSQTEFIVKWLPDGTRTFVNESYCRYFGVREEDCLGTSFFPLVAPEYRESILRKIASITPENPEATEEHPSFVAGGGLRWQQWTDVGTFDGEGRLVELLSTGRDITERKQAEEKLQAYSERLKALSQQILQTQETERRRLARELHDEIGQMLTAIGLDLHRLRKQCSDEVQAIVDQDVALVQRAIAQVREMSLDLRPPMLDVLGLESALRWYIDSQRQRWEFDVQLHGHLESTARFPEVEIACFRVVQEALTNIARHARARHVHVDLSQDDSELQVAIHDDGVGFDVFLVQKRAGHGGSFGILGMQERVELLGGAFEIDSAPGRGTRIVARFPMLRPPIPPEGPP